VLRFVLSRAPLHVPLLAERFRFPVCGELTVLLLIV